ncbi:Zinc ribbon domain protein [Aquisphaera giovannonii]|uniref:Zinc ribbon domain protein n=1 Tax=Aquisphaera giovannonii TaxID=406548 RepID=A0A5B9WFP2_9BACT|nr:zinc ribbon domain-containing protein [Aquisphaera giovannonii]QEH39064.1 Zinc ribbon domain protein [Aquisphaera giovannonii]
MPIYEYRCEPCRHTFETLIRSSSDVARCPKCGNIDVAKEFSVPAAAQVGGRGSSSLPVCASDAPSMGCGRPQCGSGGCAFG